MYYNVAKLTSKGRNSPVTEPHLLNEQTIMDDLLAGFQGGLSVSSDPYDPCRPHPRLSQYKLKREGYADQEARRRKALEEQNTRRKDFADYARRIIEGELFSDDEMEEGGVVICIHTFIYIHPYLIIFVHIICIHPFIQHMMKLMVIVKWSLPLFQKEIPDNVARLHIKTNLCYQNG